MELGVTVALCMLIVVVVGHTVYLGRWSGRVDAIQDNVISQQKATAEVWDRRFQEQEQRYETRFAKQEAEINRLREARHQADGILQRHEGVLKWLAKGREE